MRQCKYPHNIVEQDHRAIKRITRPMLGFKSLRRVRVLLAGTETMHMIRKGQMGHPKGQVASATEQFYALAFCASANRAGLLLGSTTSSYRDVTRHGSSDTAFGARNDETTDRLSAMDQSWSEAAVGHRYYVPYSGSHSASREGPRSFCGRVRGTSKATAYCAPVRHPSDQSDNAIAAVRPRLSGVHMQCLNHLKPSRNDRSPTGC
jgi:hypothetical protein